MAGTVPPPAIGPPGAREVLDDGERTCALYGAITRLEQRGWIRPVGAGDRRQPYRLTAAGRRHLEEQLSELEAVVRVGLRRPRQA